MFSYIILFQEIEEFSSDLFIGNMYCSGWGIPSQVSQMDQEGEDIIPAPEVFQVVLEAGCVDTDLRAGNQVCNSLLQSVKVQFDIVCQTLGSRRFSPEGMTSSFFQRIHHGIRIVNGDQAG